MAKTIKLWNDENMKKADKHESLEKFVELKKNDWNNPRDVGGGDGGEILLAALVLATMDEHFAWKGRVKATSLEEASRV